MYYLRWKYIWNDFFGVLLVKYIEERCFPDWKNWKDFNPEDVTLKGGILSEANLGIEYFNLK